MQFKKVSCPKCGRTISHYLSGTDSIYRNICPKCKETVVIYSAGKTVIITEISIELKINF
ncbi:MAG: hypothetical protein ACFFCV_19980 [Promethearchaeota archaeon]